ncbi:MAG: EAL domain-containing protein [Lachnospiraceae bacterium]|nr:EAL domain-containing protein [Lachnospiraceae bacterium]
MECNDMCAENEPLRFLSHIYYKIVKINLATEVFEYLKGGDDQDDGQGGCGCHISRWFRNFVETGQIYYDDEEKFLLFADIQRMRESFRDGSKYICCHCRIKIDGEFRWVSLELAPSREYSYDNEVVYLYVKNIHEEMKVDFEERDFVTGGLNRRGFLRQGRRYLDGMNAPRELAVLVFNIKGFKAINELFGVEGGDELLRLTYDQLKSSTLHPILIARIEGDRFACLVERKNLDYGMLPDICRRNFVRDEKNISVYVRCGIYPVEDKRIPVNTMCDYAKIAIGCIVDEYLKPYAIFDQSMRINYIIRSEVRGRIGIALESREFQVYYQPVFHARTGRLVSAEALVRWNHPRQGLLSPEAFIPALEESGHITRLDSFVLEEVKRFQRERKMRGLHTVPISVNLSWMDFFDEAVVGSIMEDLKGGVMERIPVRFEVTETCCAALMDRGDHVIADLRGAGASILLDDFGSGSTSFSVVSDCDFDMIKLDMGIVQKITTGGKIKSIIHSMIDMVHHLGAKVIAEGVETQEQLDFLNRHDCDYIQGNYFSKPLREEQFLEILENGLKKEIPLPVEKQLSLTDLISVETLQKIQDAFSDMSGMAALTTDRDGVPVTQGSNFTEFCMKHTRNSVLGAKRCSECDRIGAEVALDKGNSCAYECHAGLVDFSAPIMANGEMLGCFIGGQVLPERPDREKVRRIAQELGIDPQQYEEAAWKVNVVDKERIDKAARSLYTIANVLSDMAYHKYMMDVGNDMLREKNMELDFLANYDMLTKLNNRHHMMHFFRQFEESGKPFCVIIGDIDDFKVINDTYGHDCGDLVLYTVADIIKNTLGQRGVPCRWGGEEFLMLVYGEQETAGEILELVRHKIEQNVVNYHGQDVRVTMTFGMAFYKERANVEKMISLADQRLYYGKNHGKNRIVMAS